MVAVITLDNALSAAALDSSILTGHAGQDAIGLLASGAAIYATKT